jgi:hypothetical protein
LGKRQITVCDITSNNSISVGNVETIIHEHLLCKEVRAQWVPKMLRFGQKAQEDEINVSM